jgi:hypothetical protein
LNWLQNKEIKFIYSQNKRRQVMKKLYKSTFVLVLGIAACSSVMGQKSSEYDDVYYIPSDKKTVQSTDKPETVPSSTVNPQKNEVSDYEKYINSLNYQNSQSQKLQPQVNEDSLDYAQDPNYAGSEYAEKDGSTYVTNNYYSNPDDYYYATQLRRFYNPLYSAGYYDPFYMDPYYYGGGFGFGMSFGYPYYGFSMSFGYPYYGYGYPYYGYGYGYPYYGYGYPYYPYYGYDYGYNCCYYNHGGGGDYHNNHAPAYYGPRRAIEQNRTASARNSVASDTRRMGTSSVARTSAGTSAYGRRSYSDGNSVARTSSGTAANSTRTLGTSTSRRPYGTSAGSSAYNRTPSTTRTLQGSGATTSRSSSAQDRPVYTRPSTTTSQSRPTYSGGSSGSRSTGSTTYSRPSSSGSSSYSRPSSSGSSSYSRPSSSGSSSYSRPSSSSSYSGGSRSSGSSSSYSGGSRSSGGGSSYSGGGSSSGGSRSSGGSSSGSRR